MSRIDDFKTANRSAIDALVAEAMPALIHAAVQECANRNGRLLAWSFGELDAAFDNWYSAHLLAKTDKHYRRGYLHGFGAAMDDLKVGCKRNTWQALAVFYDGPLTHWRYDDNKKVLNPPPSPSRSKAVA